MSTAAPRRDDSRRPRSLRVRPRWLGETWRRPAGAFGLLVVTGVLAAATVSLVWTPHPLLAADVTRGWHGPSWEHLLGTDLIGRDTLSWLLAGAQPTVVVVVASVVLAALVGLPLGALGALLPSRWSEPVVVVIDILVALPVLLVAMLLAAPFGGSLAVVVIAVGFAAGVNVARVTRPELVRASQSDYVLAARASGVGAVGRLVQHIVPNISPVMIVQLSQTAGTAILAEAGLTFLGYGAPTSTPSWGRALADAQSFIGVAPLSVVWPGLTIAVTVLALNLLGDALREAVDPRLRRGPVASQRAVAVLTGAQPAVSAHVASDGVEALAVSAGRQPGAQPLVLPAEHPGASPLRPLAVRVTGGPDGA